MSGRAAHPLLDFDTPLPPAAPFPAAQCVAVDDSISVIAHNSAPDAVDLPWDSEGDQDALTTGADKVKQRPHAKISIKHMDGSQGGPSGSPCNRCGGGTHFVAGRRVCDHCGPQNGYR